MTQTETSYISRFNRAQQSADEVVLEGIHALKHALRFGAEIRQVVTPDAEKLLNLGRSVAPDVLPTIAQLIEVVSPECFKLLSRRPPGSPVLAIAAIAAQRREAVADAPVVVLFEPRHAGNTGAVIRVAAAAGAASVLVTGGMDPWSAEVVRAAAGLQYAIEVAAVDWPLTLERPLIAFDPDVGDTDYHAVPADAALIFGGERNGLPQSVLESADRIVRIPMRAGVSSLNLATSVAVALYSRQQG